MRDAGAAADERDQHNPAFLRPLQLCRPSVCHTFLEVTKGDEEGSEGESSLTKAHASNDRTDQCPFLSLFWQAVPETLEILRCITSPISVVSGVGPQRLGKSTILNLFHSRKTSGFGLGHTMDAQTTGIWIWLRRHPRDEDLVRALESNMFGGVTVF
jgi:hypothetical protein